MLNTSLRRVARAYPSATSISSRPVSANSISSGLTSNVHQRRHSSSKPPVPPNNGSQPIAATSVKTVGGPRAKDASEKRPGTESRLSKRKVPKDKSEQNEWNVNLPSVPSTQHLSEKDVSLASFFSIHRPISINSPLPPQVSPEDFEKIFQPRPKPSRSKAGSQEVMYTLASAVHNIDETISQHQSPQNSQTVQQRADIIAALTQGNNDIANQNADNQAQSQQLRVANGVKIVIQEIARRFRPYNPPPAPIAISDSEIVDQEAEAASQDTHAEVEEETRALELELESQDRGRRSQMQPVILNLRENEDVHVRRSLAQHQPPRLQDLENSKSEAESELLEHEIENTITFREEATCSQSLPYETPEQRQHQPYMERRRSRFDQVYAISVKRQRRLKMKKHKYKKLMRKTRNLRRRQDRL